MIARSRFALVAAAMLLAIIGLFQSRRTARYRDELTKQSTTASRLEGQIQQSRDATDQLLKLVEAERDTLPEAADPGPAPGPVDSAEVGRWLNRLKQLKQAFDDRPAQKIPQLALLTDPEWVALARAVQFDTEDGINRALADARTAAKSHFVGSLYPALEAYLEAHHGNLPSSLADLLPTLAEQANQRGTEGQTSAADPAMFAQYELTATGKFSEAPIGAIVKEKALFDEELDHRIELMRDADDGLFLMETSTSTSVETVDDGNGTFERSVRAFAAANQGAAPNTPSDLLPFLTGPRAHNIAESITQHPTAPQESTFFKIYAAKVLAEPPVDR